MGLKRVAWKGLAGNGLAVKRIYIGVLSGRGRAPKVREAGNARGWRRASGAVLKFSNKNRAIFWEISPWFAPVREPARVFAMERGPRFAWELLGYGLEAGGICGSSRP